MYNANEIAFLSLLIPAATFCIGGLLGFITSRMILTKNESLNHQQILHENSEKIKQSKDAKFQDFTSAMARYINKTEPPNLDDFLSISTTGTLYFNELANAADAVLNGRVDSNSRDRSFVPSFVDAWNKSIPAYYDTLQILSDKIDTPFNGQFKRENYLSIITSIEKYAPNDLIPPVSDNS